MHTDVKRVPESANAGSCAEGMVVKLGRMSLNHGVGESSSLNHCPVGPAWSFSRL